MPTSFLALLPRNGSNTSTRAFQLYTYPSIHLSTWSPLLVIRQFHPASIWNRLCQTRGSGTAYRHKMFRVRDRLWMYLTSFVITRTGVELATVQKNPDCVVVGLQLYSARTFHVTLSPGYIRAGRDLPQMIINT